MQSATLETFRWYCEGCHLVHCAPMKAADAARALLARKAGATGRTLGMHCETAAIAISLPWHAFGTRGMFKLIEAKCIHEEELGSYRSSRRGAWTTSLQGAGQLRRPVLS
jgi:hypothetical protein